MLSEFCADSDGTSVDLEGSIDSDVSGTDSSAGDVDVGSDDASDDFAGPQETCFVVGGRCFGPPPIGDTEEAPAPSVPQQLSASDLTSIAPNPVAIRMEPQGWALLHQPVNFWVTASTHSKQGMLLGYPVTVTFTPSHIDWNYGDGATGTSNTVGASWDALGLPEFSLTQTSHTYTERGEYTVTATVHYTAAVDIAGQRLHVSGHVTATSTLAGFELFTVDGVLVPPGD